MEDADYVIIGAGTAGCVLAARLSEDPGVRVALVEAGGSDRSVWIQLPIGYGRTFFDPRINWMYESQGIPALGGRTSYWPRGKVIGGSGSINAMVQVRGRPEDFEDWRAEGNPGWGWEDVLPYFIRAEDWEGGPAAWRGTGGPQHVSDLSARVHPLCGRFIETGRALGLGVSADFNGPEGEGVGLYQITTRRGRRDSTANAYLRPALKRPNLALLSRTHVHRILFDGRRAVGIACARGGAERVIRARRGVVLAAGAVGSPMILERSGVGAAGLLAGHGIPVVADLPAVGEGLQDHLAISNFYETSVPTLNQELRPFGGKLKAALRYLVDRGGPLSMSVNQAGGFVRSAPDAPRVDLQLYFSPVSYMETPLSERRLLKPDPFPAFLLSFNACRPTSQGRLHIASADPHAPPVIEPNYLATGRDVDEARAGLRLLRRIAGARPLADIIRRERVPGPDCATEEAWLEDFRARADTVYHPTSTCRMGPDPATAVVDPRLRVHGLGGLHVVDASVFPSVTSGNVNAPTVMVAEKGAAMLREDARATA